MQNSIKNKTSFINRANIGLFFIFFFLLAFFLADSVFAQLDPSAPPPEDNTPELIRIDETSQAKSGALRFGTDDATSPFTYQLEVLGSGAQLSNAMVDNELSVNQSNRTLFVDPVTHRVCVGECIDDADSVLQVGDGRVHVSGVDDTGIQGMSQADIGLYGSGATYGVQGVSSNPLGYGMWAVSTLSSALIGSHTGVVPAYSSVAGFSDTGVAIYGANTNLNNLWSSYFSGIVESSEIISAAKVLATEPGQSFIPYTAGQLAGQYFTQYYPGRLATDGRFLWIAQMGNYHDYLLQVDKGTGTIIARFALGPAQDLIYDPVHQYIWQASETYSGSIGYVDVTTGTGARRTVRDTDGHGTCPFGFIVRDPNDADILWALQSGGNCFGRDYYDRLLKLSIADLADNPTTWEPLARYDIVHDEAPTAPFTEGPRALTFDTDTNTVWAAFLNNDAVYRIDAADPGNGDTLVTSADYTRYDVPGPTDLAVDPDHQYVWVSADDSGTDNDGAYYIDISAGTVSGRIITATGAVGPQAITYDGTNVWVATYDGSTGVADRFSAGSPGAVTHFSISGNRSYRDILYDPVVEEVWVPSWYGNSVSGLSVSDGSVQQFYDYSARGFSVRHHDGTYVWLTRNAEVYKVRAADGFIVFRVSLAGTPSDVLFDANAVWVTDSDADMVYKLDPYDGSTVCSLSLQAGDAPVSIVFDGRTYWLTATGSGDVVQVSNTCGELQRIHVTATPQSLGRIVYNGSYLWVVASADNGLININPATGNAVLWDNLVGVEPSDIFYDNYNYWVANRGTNSVTAFYLTDAKHCSLDQSMTCSTDADCGSNGGCFADPQSRGSFSVGNEPVAVTFDGTYVWTANASGSSLTRLLAADPTVREDVPLTFSPLGLLFDKTYLWSTGTGSAGDVGLVKLFSGVGYGTDSTTDGLALQSASPLTWQRGSYSISGDARVGQSVNIAGDLDGDNNWGEAASGDAIFNTNLVVWDGINALPDGGHDVQALIRASDGSLYAGAVTVAGARVFKSTDNGASWVNTGGPASGTQIDALYEASNGDLYAGTGGGNIGYIFRSTDQGATWPLLRMLNGQGPVTAFLEDDADNLYAAAGFGATAYVYKSTDGGGTWNNTGAIANATNIYDLIQIDDGSILAATGNVNGNVMRTTDRGATWTDTGNLAGVDIVHDIIQAADGSLYAGVHTGVSGNVVFRSTNRGTSWGLVGAAPGAVQGYSLTQTSDGALYLGAAVGVGSSQLYRSANNGTSWTEVSGLPGGATAYVIVSSDGAPRYNLYVGLSSTSGVASGEFGPLPAGTYNCPEGHFVTNIETNDSDQVVLIECRPL